MKGAAGFAVGLVAGLGTFWLAYKAAKPAILREIQRQTPSIVRRSVNPATNGVIDAIGGDRTLEALAFGFSGILERELP